MINFEQFKEMELRTAKVLSVEDHPNADRLYVIKVDIGEEEPRTIVGGIKQWYAAEDLVGKTVIVLANLEPATLRGVESCGMLLAASTPERDSVVVLTTEKDLPPGCSVS